MVIIIYLLTCSLCLAPSLTHRHTHTHTHTHAHTLTHTQMGAVQSSENRQLPVRGAENWRCSSKRSHTITGLNAVCLFVSLSQCGNLTHTHMQKSPQRVFFNWSSPRSWGFRLDTTGQTPPVSSVLGSNLAHSRDRPSCMNISFVIGGVRLCFPNVLNKQSHVRNPAIKWHHLSQSVYLGIFRSLAPAASSSPNSALLLCVPFRPQRSVPSGSKYDGDGGWHGEHDLPRGV